MLSGYYAAKYKFNEEQLRYFTSLGPFQTKLQQYPKNKELHSAKKTCMFAAKWFDEYPYLEYSVVKDAAFCFICRLFAEVTVIGIVYNLS